MNPFTHRMTKRSFLKLTLLGAAGLLLPAGALASGPQALSSPVEQERLRTALERVARHHGEEAVRETALLAPYLVQGTDVIESPPHIPFRERLPLAPVLAPDGVVLSEFGPADHYTIVERVGEKEYLPGLTTPIWSYNGMHPGPTLLARLGRPVVVTYVNQLPAPTIVHLHGGHQPAEHDGFAADHIDPGERRHYHWPNRPDSKRGYTLWYHDHRMDVTSQHVCLGLAGFYLLDDEFEEGLREERLLPGGLAGSVPPREARDIPLVIQDRRFAPDGRLYFQLNPGDRGNLGDKILVNGAIQPRFEVATRKYRLRILNGALARDFLLALSAGLTFTQIGNEGGLLMKPIERQTLLISNAERFDVIVDFARVPVGSRIFLRNLFGNNLWSEGDPEDVMRFDVVREEKDDVQGPPSPLRPVEPLTFPEESQAVQRRRFVLERGNGIWLLNGRPWSTDRDDATPVGGTVEVWDLINQGGGWVHPFHLHDEFFRVLRRNGRPAPDHEALGYKDTVRLGPNDEVCIVKYFSPDFPGRFNFHCHNTDHEDHSMMGVCHIMPRGRSRGAAGTG